MKWFHVATVNLLFWVKSIDENHIITAMNEFRE